MALAEAANGTRADVEQWLSEVELEAADPKGALRFPLTEAQRAAAALLAEDLEDRRVLAELVAQQRADVAHRKASKRIDMSEGPVYEKQDSHGSHLLCIDSSIFNAPTTNEEN